MNPHRPQRLALLGPSRGERGASPLELRAGPLELLLALRDLVAGRPDGLDGAPHLVAQLAHPVDDRGILTLEPLQVLGALEHVIEAVGLEHDGEQVRLARLVDRDEPVFEDLDRALEAAAQLDQPGAGALELGLLRRELAGQRGLLVAELGHLPLEGCDALRGCGDLGGEHALLALDRRELVLGALQPLLQRLRGGAGGREHAGAERERGEAGSAEQPPAAGAVSRRREFVGHQQGRKRG